MTLNPTLQTHSPSLHRLPPGPMAFLLAPGLVTRASRRTIISLISGQSQSSSHWKTGTLPPALDWHSISSPYRDADGYLLRLKITQSGKAFRCAICEGTVRLPLCLAHIAPMEDMPLLQFPPLLLVMLRPACTTLIFFPM